MNFAILFLTLRAFVRIHVFYMYIYIALLFCVVLGFTSVFSVFFTLSLRWGGFLVRSVVLQAWASREARC